LEANPETTEAVVEWQELHTEKMNVDTIGVLETDMGTGIGLQGATNS
jgi:hypothetical protein